MNKVRHTLRSVIAASLAVVLVLTLSAPQVYAEENNQLAEFFQYVEQIKAESKAQAEQTQILPEIEAINEETGYITTALDVSAPETSLQSGALPASYMTPTEAIDKYPGTRNQNPYGTCWAFATTALAEFSLITSGQVDKSIDLSELQLVYSALFNDVVDPLGGTDGDYFKSPYSDPFMSGLNYQYAMQALFKGQGMVQESTLPYSQISSVVSSGITYDQRYNSNVARITGAYILDAKDNRDLVKEAVVNNGAVGISYADSDSYWTDLGYTYYCYDSDKATNHAVAVVGWDDTYAKENFANGSAPLPDNNGAWLVRNSWTTTTGVSKYSYFWLSYEDKSYSSAYVMTFDGGTDYHIYQYDGGVATLNATYGTKEANIFTVKCGSDTETIDEVSISEIYRTDLNYKIEVYTDLAEDNDPYSGRLETAATTTGKTNAAGVYTIRLNQSVPVRKGSRYAIVVTLTDDKGRSVGVDQECGYFGKGADEVHCKEGQSYYLYNGLWLPVEDEPDGQGEGNFRIKAYTKDGGTVQDVYNIKFDGNGATSGSVDSINAIYTGETVQLRDNNFVRKNYTFAGWNTKADGTGTSYSAGQSVSNLATSGTVTLYAKWTKNQYEDTTWQDAYNYTLDQTSNEILLYSFWEDLASDLDVVVPSVAVIDGKQYRTSIASGSIFAGCESVKSITFQNVDTSRITDTGVLFYSCTSLTKIDMSNLDMSNLDENSEGYVYYMLNGCDALKEIKTPKNLGHWVALPYDFVKEGQASERYECLPMNQSSSITIVKATGPKLYSDIYLNYYGADNVTAALDVQGGGSDALEYSWLVYDYSTGQWSQVSDWQQGNIWVSWNPGKAGDYLLMGKARWAGSEDEGESTSKCIGLNLSFPSVSSGIYLVENQGTKVVAGLVIDGTDVSKLDYSWLGYDISKEMWFQISDWTQGNNWVDWNPGKTGDFLLVGKARWHGTNVEATSATLGVNHKQYLSEQCQMPNPNGSGYLIGISSFDNPNNTYRYEMLILDCEKLSAGDPSPWVYDSGMLNANGGNTAWAVWSPKPGYYWTLFRLYDTSGNLLDEVCYGFMA